MFLRGSLFWLSPEQGGTDLLIKRTYLVTMVVSSHTEKLDKNINIPGLSSPTVYYLCNLPLAYMLPIIDTGLLVVSMVRLYPSAFGRLYPRTDGRLYPSMFGLITGTAIVVRDGIVITPNDEKDMIGLLLSSVSLSSISVFCLLPIGVETSSSSSYMIL